MEEYSLPFSSLPPLTSPVFLTSYQSPEKRRALHDAVKEMEMKGAIEVIRTPSPGFYSRLFLVQKAGGTWRPIIDLSVLNTHIQCPSFKMETNGSLLKALHKGQWLTILDLKDAILSHPHSPLLQAVPPVLPRGRGLAIPSSSFWVKHCTTSVYSGHGTCRLAYAHLNGVSLHVYLDDWLLNPISEELSKYQSRPRLPLRKEDRTMALHLGGFPSGAGPACPAVVTTFGAPSFPREASSLRPVAYPTHSVPTSLRMVSNQRSSSDPGQPGSRDPGFHSLVENSFKSPQRNPTRIPSDRSLPLHRLKCCGLGCSHGQKDRLRKVVPRPCKSCTSMCWN